VENLDADKRPLAATADFHELFQVVSVTIGEDTSTTVQLLFGRRPLARGADHHRTIPQLTTTRR
jgi:hypothetical protein